MHLCSPGHASKDGMTLRCKDERAEPVFLKAANLRIAAREIVWGWQLGPTPWGGHVYGERQA